MNKGNVLYLAALAAVFMLSGCVVRTYPLTRDRVDQDLSAGNRGFIQGQGSPQAENDRKSTRTTQVVEVELRSPIKFEKMPQTKIEERAATTTNTPQTTDEEAYGNRGYITESRAPAISEPAGSGTLEKYTVKKGDTLQKISKKIYGTSKKYMKLYELNKDTLKAPNKIYPGQVINVPAEKMKETKENLK